MGSTSSEGVTLISQGTGYGLLIGLAVLFCGVILIAIKVQKAYLLGEIGNVHGCESVSWYRLDGVCGVFVVDVD